MSKQDIRVTQNIREVKEGATVIGVQVNYQGEPVLIPSPDDIQLHRDELTKIENYSRWADDFYIDEESKVLPLYASPYEDTSGRKRENLLQTIREHQRVLVLGEPGMGKTVAMERMVWETAQANEAVVPIFVPLLYFQGADLAESIRVALSETRKLNFENLKSVRAFLKETKCLILLDGLNEVPGRQREQVIGAIANFMREFADHRYVVTSRSQDELWRKLRSSELIKDAVVVQNISDEQAQGYLEAHLGKKVGQALYNQLDDSLKALARTPLLLKLIRDAGQGSDKLPRNRGELFDRFVMNRLLERDRKLELVESPEGKKKALAHIAFALQLDHQLACERSWAEKILSDKGMGHNAKSILNEALLHGLLIQQNQLLRFMHQSVQEYFVALTLRYEAEIEKNANFLQNASRRISRYSIDDWAKDDWWNESFVQLAGLVEDADWLAHRIVKASPWLAWWCVEEGRDVKESTRELIETRSIKLLHSEKPTDRYRAGVTLSKIKSERTLEQILFMAGDRYTEIVNLGLDGLINAGESGRLIVERAIKDNKQRDWMASIRYLARQADDSLWAKIPVKAWEELFGISMIWIPPGPFLMGSSKLTDPQAKENEFPQHEINLSGYWIGRYPITRSQYYNFLREDNYEAKGRYWGSYEEEADDHPARGVLWQDAVAYCNWLRKTTGIYFRLPSETEWEKAARGLDNRIYPWGNNFVKEMCNSDESGIGRTTSIGSYSPNGDSPYDCADMSGNIWEWTRSVYKPYPYDPQDGREDIDREDVRVLRGGSWVSDKHGVRISCRTNFSSNLREGYYYGFRVVASPPTKQE